MGAIAFSVFNYKSCLTGKSACWFATFKFRVRLTMSFIITRLAVSLLDSTFVPRRVYKFLCLFSVLRVFSFSFLLGAHTQLTHLASQRSCYSCGVCVFVCVVGFCKARFVCVEAHTHAYICHE